MLQLFTYVFDYSALINSPMILLTKHGRSRLVIEVMRRRLLLEIVLVLMYRQYHLTPSATESLKLRFELHLLLHSIPKQFFPVPSIRGLFFNDHLTYG